MAYRTDLNPGSRSGAIIAVVAVHAALLFALLHMSGKIDLGDPQRVLKVFDVASPPPPPPAPPPVQPRPKQSAPAPKNLKSEATSLVAPKPQIQTPQLPVIVATETPRQGAQTTQGASDVRGPGTGAGGTGTGSGNGAGTGGDAIAERAHLMSPPLSSRDFPPEMEQRLASGAAPFVMFTVLPTGRVTNCRIYQSSGDPALDGETCALVVSRFVYRPAFNRRGEAVASEMAYRQAQ